MTLRETIGELTFGGELTLVTAQDSSDIGATRGLDGKVQTSQDSIKVSKTAKIPS